MIKVDKMNLIAPNMTQLEFLETIKSFLHATKHKIVVQNGDWFLKKFNSLPVNVDETSTHECVLNYQKMDYDKIFVLNHYPSLIISFFINDDDKKYIVKIKNLLNDDDMYPVCEVDVLSTTNFDTMIKLYQQLENGVVLSPVLKLTDIELAKTHFEKISLEKEIKNPQQESKKLKL
jgi:hypothetical protein